MYSFLTARSRALVTAADVSSKLKAYVGEMTTQQQKQFFGSFPRTTAGWFVAVDSKAVGHINPKLVLALDNQSITSPESFERFLLTWADLRKIVPPTVGGSTIYRITRVPEYPAAPTIVLSSKNQLKAAVSWSLAKTPKVTGNKFAATDKVIIMSHKLEGTKHVLFDFRSALEVFSSLQADLAYYLTTYPELQAGKNVIRYWIITLVDQLKRYAKEKEVVIYLNKGESIECDWRKA